MLENVFPKSMFTNNRLGVRCVCCFYFIGACVRACVHLFSSLVFVLFVLRMLPDNYYNEFDKRGYFQILF